MGTIEINKEFFIKNSDNKNILINQYNIIDINDINIIKDFIIKTKLKNNILIEYNKNVLFCFNGINILYIREYDINFINAVLPIINNIIVDYNLSFNNSYMFKTLYKIIRDFSKDIIINSKKNILLLKNIKHIDYLKNISITKFKKTSFSKEDYILFLEDTYIKYYENGFIKDLENIKYYDDKLIFNINLCNAINYLKKSYLIPIKTLNDSMIFDYSDYPYFNINSLAVYNVSMFNFYVLSDDNINKLVYFINNYKNINYLNIIVNKYSVYVNVLNALPKNNIKYLKMSFDKDYINDLCYYKKFDLNIYNEDNIIFIVKMIFSGYNIDFNDLINKFDKSNKYNLSIRLINYIFVESCKKINYSFSNKYNFNFVSNDFLL